MGIEDVEVGRERSRQPLVPLRDDLSGSLERFHETESSRALPGDASRATLCRFRKGHCRPRAAGVSKGAVMSSLIGGSMKRIHLLVLLSLLALPLAAAPASGSGAGSIVVGELYASGGNSGAAYANDYVELFNRGAGAVAVDGWTVQYASAASATWQTTALSGSIPAGGRYLVQLASGGTNGAALPAADATGTSNLAATGGKVAIVNDATALDVRRLRGKLLERRLHRGSRGLRRRRRLRRERRSSARSATMAMSRAGGGCTDTDDNAADFAAAAPIRRTRRRRRAHARDPRPPNGPSGSPA